MKGEHMNNNIKLLLIDDNVELVGMIKEYFSSHANIKVVKEAYNGEEGLEYIKNNPKTIATVVAGAAVILTCGFYLWNKYKKKKH